jgi:hypothetical protein
MTAAVVIVCCRASPGIAEQCSGSEWIARVNCGGTVRVVRDDVLLVRWLVQRARFLLQKLRSG